MFGTVIFATRREQFAILAADSLYHAPGRKPFKRSKIVLHPTLPLAVAAAGFETLPPVGGKATTEHVREIIEGLDTEVPITISAVVEALIDHLHPLVRSAYAEQFPLVGDKARCELAVALYADGQSYLTWICLKESVNSGPIKPHRMIGPDGVMKFLMCVHNDDASAYFGTDIEDPERLIAHVSDVMAGAVEVDADTNPDAREVDFPIDIAIVDCDGARLVKTMNGDS